MTADELRGLQAPLKQTYRDHPEQARQTMAVEGRLNLGSVSCSVQTTHGVREAGLHPAAGGPGTFACSGDMLLEALVGCAGTTLSAVATAMQVPIRGGVIRAEGDMDFRGTLGVDKQTPIGFTAIRLRIQLDTDAPAEQIQQLIKLTERYCVIYQTLVKPPTLTTTLE